MSVEEALKVITEAGYTVSKPKLEEKRYSIKEAADIMNRSESRIYSLVSKKDGFPPKLRSKKIGGTVYIYQSYIDEYNNRNSKTSKLKSDFEADAETYCNNER